MGVWQPGPGLTDRPQCARRPLGAGTQRRPHARIGAAAAARRAAGSARASRPASLGLDVWDHGPGAAGPAPKGSARGRRRKGPRGEGRPRAVPATREPVTRWRRNVGPPRGPIVSTPARGRGPPALRRRLSRDGNRGARARRRRAPEPPGVDCASVSLGPPPPPPPTPLDHPRRSARPPRPARASRAAAGRAARRGGSRPLSGGPHLARTTDQGRRCGARFRPPPARPRAFDAAGRTPRHKCASRDSVMRVT